MTFMSAMKKNRTSKAGRDEAMARKHFQEWRNSPTGRECMAELHSGQADLDRQARHLERMFKVWIVLMIIVVVLRVIIMVRS